MLPTPRLTASRQQSSQWLDVLLREKCDVEALRPHQSLHSYDLVRGRDVFLVIATGSGKTLIILAPLIAAQACRESGIALLLVPTKALGEEHKITAEKYNIATWVINQDSLRDASADGRDLFKELFKATGMCGGGQNES